MGGMFGAMKFLLMFKSKTSKEEMKPKEAIAEIISNLKKGDTKVKTHGEVMTPIWLVEDMLNTLPKEVWSNPNLKWLDSCSGIGVFFSVVLERLMEGIRDFEPNGELRYKHIIENMFWACEIQEDKVKTYCEIFNPNGKYKLNIHIGSYLEWKPTKFDVIVMNPPYQVLKEGNKKSQPLWDKFVIKALFDLVEGGYLVAIHPDGWRSVSGAFKNVKKVLKSKQILYLELHNMKDGKKTFGAETPYDFYCLYNAPPILHTKIKGSDEIIQYIDISQREFIPNGMFKDFDKLIAKEGEEVLNLLYSRTLYGSDKNNMSKKQIEEYAYPCVYITQKDGSKQIWYSSVDKGHFRIPKVIFSNGRSSYPIIDELGEYGIMNFAYAIVDSVENLPYIQKALLNPEFIKLMSFSWGSDHRYNPKVIALFRKDFWKDFI
jgi:hypothetical protein